jgi:endonuclease/exonuclease/phosphatase (EEP) superfamily protein YafD
MATVLFWNVGRNPRCEQISQLAKHCEVDVILLAEVVDQPVDLLRSLNISETDYHYAPGRGNKTILVFARFPAADIAPIYENDRLTVRRLKPLGVQEVLLAVLHLPSKRSWSEKSQASECIRIADEIRDVEEVAGHQRTIVVGDFNMNPFESAMVSAIGMHAIMDRRIARGQFRKVQGRNYPFFYNPMWNLFGDHTRGPAGTFFYRDAQQEVYFWNMFDQVLIRPALLDRFQMDDFRILDHNGLEPLLTRNGRPNKSVGSDHLPVLFRLSP